MTIDGISTAILKKARTEQFAGYDPFDGLNSSWFSWMPVSKDSLFGLVWIQLFKRSPINLRPWLGVNKARNPKGVALFILGLIEHYQVTKDEALLQEAKELAVWLVEQRCDEQQWHGACWGYHFDWKARAFFVPKGKPNVITTVYVSRALYQLGHLIDQPEWIELALSSGDFIARHLLTQSDYGVVFCVHSRGNGVCAQRQFVGGCLAGCGWPRNVSSRLHRVSITYCSKQCASTSL